NRSDGTITEIDAATRKERGTPIRVGTDPSGIALSEGQIFVANGSDGTVSEANTGSGVVTTTTTAGQNPQVAAAPGAEVWAASDTDSSLWQFNGSMHPIRTIGTGAAPSSVSVSGDQVWVTAVATPTGIHRGGTLRVIDTSPLSSIDPALALPDAW